MDSNRVQGSELRTVLYESFVAASAKARTVIRGFSSTRQHSDGDYMYTNRPKIPRLWGHLVRRVLQIITPIKSTSIKRGRTVSLIGDYLPRFQQTCSIRKYCSGKLATNSLNRTKHSSEPRCNHLLSTTKSQHQVQRTLLLNIVVGQCTAVLQLLSRENQTLLVRRNTFLVLNL